MTCTLNYNDNKSKLYERLYNYDSETADYYYSLITDLYKKQPFIELSLITKDLMNNDSYYNPLIIDKLGDFKTFRKELINNRYKYTLDESSSNVEDLYVLPVNVITTNPQLNHLYQLDKSNKVFYSNYDLSVPLINNRTKLFEQSTNINDFSIHNGVFHIGYNQLSKLNRLYPNLDRKSLLVEYLYNHNKESFDSLLKDTVILDAEQYSVFSDNNQIELALLNKQFLIRYGDIDELEQLVNRTQNLKSKINKPLFNIDNTDKQNDVLSVLDDMNSRVKFNEEYVKEDDELIINPLTNSPIKKHEYFLIKDSKGEPINKRINNSVTKAMDEVRPFDRWYFMLDINNPNRWKYLDKEFIEFINDEDLFGKRSVVNTNLLFDDSKTNTMKSKIEMTNAYRDFVLHTIKEPLDVDKLIAMLSAKINLSDKQIKLVSDNYLTLRNRLINMEYSKEIGTNVHESIQAMLYVLDIEQDKVINTDDIIPILRGFNDGSIHSDNIKTFLQSYDNFPTTYNQLIQSVLNIHRDIHLLAQTQYKEGNNVKPIIRIENVVYTDEFKTLWKNKPAYNQDLASKIDISVVYPNGVIQIIDIKSTSTKNVNADNYVNPSFNRIDSVTKRSTKGFEYEEKTYGYQTQNQSKNGLQLEIYRKILITKGIESNKIETLILPVVIKSNDGKVESIEVPDFKDTKYNVVNPNEQNRHLIYTKKMIDYSKNVNSVDLSIGKTNEQLTMDKIRNERDKNVIDMLGDNTNSIMEGIITNIYGYIADREANIRNSTLSREAKDELLNELNKLKTKLLSTTKDITKLIQFVEYANQELNGRIVNGSFDKGIFDKFRDTINAFRADYKQDPIEAIRVHLTNIQDYYEMTSNLSLLNDIHILLGNDSTTLFSKDFKEKLDMSINSYSVIMNTYSSVSREMLAKALFQFHDKNIDNEYYKLLDNRLNEGIRKGLFTLDTVTEYKDDLSNGNNIEAKAISDDKYNRVHSIYRDLDRIKVTEESIYDDLDFLKDDISSFSAFALSTGMMNDKSLQLLFKMFKTKDIEAQNDTNKSIRELDKEYQKYLAAVGNSNNSTNLFKPLLEEKEVYYYDRNTESHSKMKVYQFIEEYDTDYKLQQYELQTKLRKAIEANNKLEEIKVRKEVRQWEKLNMNRRYVDKVYEIDDLLSEDAQIKLSELDAIIYDLESNYRTSYADFTNEDREKLIKAKIAKTKLRSLYNEDGSEKTGKNLDIALSVKAYYDARSKIYDFSTDEAEYEKALLRVQQQYEKEPLKIKKWIDENTTLKFNKDFVNQVDMLELKSNLVYTLDKIDRTVNRDAYNELFKLLTNLTSETTFEEFEDSVNSLLSKYNIELQKPPKSENQDKINQLVRPYRNNKGEVNVDLIIDNNPKLLELIKQLQANKGESTIDISDNNLKAMYQLYQSILKDTVKYDTTAEYDDIIEILKAQYGENYINSEWFIDNHIEKMNRATNETYYIPLSIWSKRVPKTYNKRDNKVDNEIINLLEIVYKDIKGTDKTITDNNIVSVIEELLLIDNEYTDFIKSLINEGLYITNNKVVLSNKVLTRSEYDIIERVPNQLYNTSKIKDSYVKSQEELDKITFTNGKMKPLDKWLNSNYKKLSNPANDKEKAIYDFYKYITTLYNEQQSLLPESSKRGNIIPSRAKTMIDTLWNREYDVKQKFKETFSNAKSDELTDGTVQNEAISEYPFGTKRNSNLINIPIFYTQYMNSNEVDTDIVSTMRDFIYTSNKYNKLNDILGIVKMMNTVFDIREDSDNVAKKDNKGRLLISKLPEIINRNSNNRFEGLGQTSNVHKALQSFIEMQIKGIQNKPSQLGQYVRLDKIVDNIIGIATTTTIGGLNPLGLTKGLINGLQAEISLQIEAYGSQFFDKSTLRKSRKNLYFGNLWKDLKSDIAYMNSGGTVAKSITGQLFDMYDPMQGNFVDSLGKTVAGNMVKKLFRSNTWFLNQYVAEYHNSMLMLITMLNTYKIMDNGDVMNWSEYKQANKDSLDKLSDKEFLDTKNQFMKRDTLLSAIKLDNNGNLSVKEGVNWELGSKRDTEIRLKIQGISRELNGAYSSVDKAKIQQIWLGRLVMMYRKYLIPSLYRRFFGIFNSRDALLSEETGSVRVGYYVTFYSDIINSFMSDINANKGKSLFNKQFKDTKALAKTYLSILSNNRIGGVSERNEKYSETELSNIRKALFEQLTLLLLASLLMLIDLDDDEDKSEVSNLRWYMMYLIKRLLKEQNALAFNPMIGNPLEDNWKVLSSPSAAQSFIERVFKVVSNALNHLSPYGDNLYYERDSGIAEEGDSKLKVSIEKLFGTLNVANMFSTTTPEEMYENLNRTF